MYRVFLLIESNFNITLQCYGTFIRDFFIHFINNVYIIQVKSNFFAAQLHMFSGAELVLNANAVFNTAQKNSISLKQICT